jgi:hypothetical protein
MSQSVFEYGEVFHTLSGMERIPESGGSKDTNVTVSIR